MLAIDEADLSLLENALRTAGEIARTGFAGISHTWEKSKGNPVTDTDIAVDEFLRNCFCEARPGYGWLSEESADTVDRLSKNRVFIVDPIDGTTAFIKRKPEFSICAAVVDRGIPVASAIYNPMTHEMFTATRGGGAFLNSVKIAVSLRPELEGCRMLVARDVIEHPAWPRKWPHMELGKRASIAYRMALVANATYDCMMALSSKHEWDIAAGALIISESGGIVTAHDGSPMTFNQRTPSHRSVVCAGPDLHEAIMQRTRDLKLPS